jgi:MFS family permease
MTADGRTSSAAPSDGADDKGSLSTKLSGAERSRWLAAVALLVLLTEQTALGFQLIAPALGGLAAEFQTTQIIWVITIFTLVGGVMTPVVGRLGDRYGKRRVLLVTAGLSLVGSVICALAPNFGVLLAGRALMGVSTAFLPITYALMRDVFPATWRDMSISIATNGVGVVTIAGPFIAGFLIDNVSLASVFWFTAVLSAVGALGTIALVPESKVRNREPIDVAGAVILVVGMLGLLLGISQVQNWGLDSGRTILCVGLSLAILIVWWVYESRIEHPFVDTRLLRQRSFATVIFAHGFAVSAITVIASYLPTFLQTPRELGGDYGFGLDATGVAKYLVIPGIMTVAGGIVVGLLSRKYGFRFFLMLGSLFIAAGAIGLSFLTTEPWMPIVMYGLVGTGAMCYAAGPNLMMTLSPAQYRGVSAGMLGAAAAVIGSAAAQFGGLLLSQNVAQLVGGYPIYSSRGVFLVFAVAAVVAIIGFAIALFVPREQRIEGVAVATDIEVPAHQGPGVR